MRSVAKKRHPVGATVLCIALGVGVAAAERAQAAPPPTRVTFPTHNPVEAGEPRARSSGVYGEFGRLDLRAPANSPRAAPSAPSVGRGAGERLAFPRRTALPAPVAPAEEELPGLGSSGPPMKITSRAEEFAH